MPSYRLKESIQALSLAGSALSISASSTSPMIVNIGGLQYYRTSAISTTLSGLTTGTIYAVYLVIVSATPTLVVSANMNSVGPAGYTAWKLVGGILATGATSGAAIKNIYGAPETDVFSYTPIVSGLGTGSGTVTGDMRRLSDCMHFNINFTKDASAGTNAGAAVTFSLLTNLAIDTAKLPNTNRTVIGTVFKQVASNPANSTVVLPGTYGNTILLSGNYTTIDAVGSDFGANTIWSIDGVIPITGWSSTPLINL